MCFTKKSLSKLTDVLSLYYDYKMCVSDISKTLHICERTISKLLKVYGTGLRSPLEQKQVIKETKGFRMSEKGKQNIREGIIKRNTPEYRAKISQTQLGERNSSSKLNTESVIAIRKEYEAAMLVGKNKTQTQMLLAEKYNVKRPTISDVVLNRTWKHL